MLTLSSADSVTTTVQPVGGKVILGFASRVSPLNPGGQIHASDAHYDYSTIQWVTGGSSAFHFSMVADPSDPNVVFAAGDRQPMDPAQPDAERANGIAGAVGRVFMWDGNQWVQIVGRDDPRTDWVTEGAQGLVGEPTAPHADSRKMVFDAASNLLEVDDGGIARSPHPVPALNGARWTSMTPGNAVPTTAPNK